MIIKLLSGGGTDALAQQKRWVIVFDEIEKAHPAILKLLMNGMDAGRISSASPAGAQGYQQECAAAHVFLHNQLGRHRHPAGSG
ncbi:MAG: hypothetical protein U1D66_13790 [Erythrobacter sp.]|nr:hypothetical protein [Erythrobacter sp.]